MSAILVDTSAWFSLYVPDDQYHAFASTWYESNDRPLITTDYIIDELLTLLRCRGENRRATEVIDELTNNPGIHIERISAGDFEASILIFRQVTDKHWSFTDCTSRVIMERLGIKQAFCFDEHFRQFGTVLVVP